MGSKGSLYVTDAPTPRRGGRSRLTSSTLRRCAALSVVASVALTGGAAHAQDPATPVQDPAQTTPTETTPAPTETTPTPTTPTTTTETTPPASSPEPTAAPNEYVESLPTGGGQTPATSAAPANPAPELPASPSEPVQANSNEDAAGKPTAKRRKPRAEHRRRTEAAAPSRRETAPTVPAAPASADPGEPASPWLLGIGLLLITAAAVASAVGRRQRAGA